MLLTWDILSYGLHLRVCHREELNLRGILLPVASYCGHIILHFILLCAHGRSVLICQL